MTGWRAPITMRSRNDRHGPGMKMKTVLLHVREDDGMEARFQAALDVVRRFDGHLTCLQATPFDTYIIGDPFGGVYAFPEVVQRVRETEEKTRARIEADLANEGVSWDWVHYDGSAAQILVERARLADLVVLSMPSHERGPDQPLPIAADVAMHARAPVLAVPEVKRPLDCAGTAVVAWNGSSEAANALRLARPMLRGASAVHIVTIGEEGGAFDSGAAAQYLSRHDIRSEIHSAPLGERKVAEAIAEVSGKLGADYLVMGAYGHSRLRELVLGGVTNEMLQDSRIPLLLAH